MGQDTDGDEDNDNLYGSLNNIDGLWEKTPDNFVGIGTHTYTHATHTHNLRHNIELNKL